MCAWWLPDAPRRTLAIRAARDPDARWHWCASDTPLETLQTTHPDSSWQDFLALCQRHSLAAVPVGVPLPLQPAQVPKPWGSEHWYTGIEARGVAGVGPAPPGMPLPWLLAGLPGHAGGMREPLLLKHLQPHAEPVFGDLYFEYHARKEELYLVTSVDPKAWPDGGRIRMGFRQEHFATVGESGLRAAFAAAGRAYADVRRRLDALLDQRRTMAGVPLDAPLAPEVLATWTAKLPPALRAEEAQRREALESFIAEHPVVAGDVIRIPPGVPHGLRHGIRVLEVQTPDYERRILYFGQKVLTAHDDNLDAACAAMCLRPPSMPPPEPLQAPAGVTRERLAQVAGWRVERIELTPGAAWRIPPAACALAIVVTGSACFDHLLRRAEEGTFIPGPALAAGSRITARKATAVLLATPEAQP